MLDGRQPVRPHGGCATHPGSGVLRQWVESRQRRGRAGDPALPTRRAVPDGPRRRRIRAVRWGGLDRQVALGAGRPVIGTTVLGSLGGSAPPATRSHCSCRPPVRSTSTPRVHRAQDRGEVISLQRGLGRQPASSRSTCAPRRTRRARQAQHCGLAPTPSERRTDSDPGARMVLPTVAWVWSSAGRTAVTEAFHRWSRARVLRDPGPPPPAGGPSNWEGDLLRLRRAPHRRAHRPGRRARSRRISCSTTAGSARPTRDDDTRGLGDWDVDRRKLPVGSAR